ncbi:hypothetical protein [Geomonas anaerohicana]|uniref:Uncharacterized protein n=1 Tax=Geomonas anaerohicana TaxID=2798583 RepID=A0ABS0YJ76_9BACT|nr:hypothetical protein [Geomonas anaerohicana]MBJ6752330.1 hypothetical protein [Geomonas anaerohicana]
MRAVKAVIAFSLLFTAPALAINEVGEAAHFVGGGLVAGAVTATVADKYWPENRALIGFIVSTASVVIGEGIQMAGGESFSSSLLDVTCHTVGAAVGAAVTDKYMLAPVVRHTSTTGTTVGIAMLQRF